MRSIAWGSLIVLACGLVGWLVDQILLLLLLGVSACLLWQWLHLYRFERWLRSDFASPLPTLRDSAWTGIAHQFVLLQRRNRRRKHKYSRILRRFRQGVAAIPDAAVVLDKNGQVQWCNAAAQQMLGLNPRQDIGLAIINLLRHPAFVDFMNAWPEHESAEFTSPVSAEQTLQVRLIPYAKKRRLLLAADISPSRRIEQMRRDFVANASHELRTPLTVIRGYLEALLDSGDPIVETWQQPLASMQQQSGRMMLIIQDLLLLSRLESDDEPPRFSALCVPELLEQIATDARNLSAEQAHDIKVEATADLSIMGAEQELRSAVSNLIFNAVQHTPARSQIHIRWYASETGLYLEITDNGEGIAAQHLARLSERFYRVDRSRRRDCDNLGSGTGTGLGLAIVKHVVQRHSGELSIESKLGVGSTFRCRFPLRLQVGRQAAS